jgi:hypothetical protein
MEVTAVIEGQRPSRLPGLRVPLKGDQDRPYPCTNQPLDYLHHHHQQPAQVQRSATEKCPETFYQEMRSWEDDWSDSAMGESKSVA